MSDTPPSHDDRMTPAGADGGPGAAAHASAGRASAEQAAAEDQDPWTLVDGLRAEVDGLKDQLLRSYAEMENVRRRSAKEREDAQKFAVSSFAKDLLAVADNLRRAVESVPESARTGALAGLVEGVEATERQMLAAFDRAGIKRMEPMDQPFDPNFHQVMVEVAGTGRPAGTVVQVLQAGYTLHGRLLREAMVGVAKASGDSPPPGSHVNTSA